MEKYNHKTIESKWQKKWEKDGLYKTKEGGNRPSQAGGRAGKKKYYILDMFPYPSGSGLHVGHPKGYIATDIFARMKMLQGYNVLHPMGWDAFGLPAENYALKNKVHPRKAVEENVARFKKQLGKIGFTYDRDREINTTDPEYYKWTQWIFVQMFKKGLAYESEEPINWCPSCRTGLANEDLEDGKCEQCGSEIERKPMKQWMLKITDYADRLLNDLEKLPDWEEAIKEMQRNWIGKSEGAMVRFAVIARTPLHAVGRGTKQSREGSNVAEPTGLPRPDNTFGAIGTRNDSALEVFTTRPDTLFGCTFMVIAPEHFLIKNSEFRIKNYAEVKKYVEKAKKKSEMERTDLTKEKTGVKLEGVTAINPVNNKEIPIFVADYVMISYGTGAIMAVPAHDERDWEFAKKYDLSIIQVVTPNITSYNKTKNLLRALEEIKKEADKEGIKFWLLGGLACAFYAGIIYREHDDIDLIVKDNNQYKKFITLLNKLGYKKIKDIKLTNKLTNTIYENNDGIGIDIGPYLKEYGMTNKDFEEKEKELNGIKLLVISKKYITSFKKRMLEKRKKDYDKIDLEYLNGKVFIENGFSINSELINGLKTLEAKKKITGWLEEKKLGKSAVNYKLKDWVFSRQRYWGEPIPIIHCEKCGEVPVPEEELPVELPEVEHYEPTGTGESPLANIEEWVNTKCPKCNGPAKRETNTMPQWAGSSWYWLRYIDAHNDKVLVDKKKEKYWSPVDFYVGGAEHATRHLIYARFWHKFLYDIGVVNYEEPFTRLQHVGLVLAEDGRKMSKRWKNVINPDDIVAKFGADSMRLYEMFMGPFSQPCAWSMEGIKGVRRFLEKIWVLSGNVKRKTKNVNKANRLVHKTIKKVGEDIEGFKFNTAIAQMMILVNEMGQEKEVAKQDFEIFLKVLAPFTPHMAEELWSAMGNKESIFKQPWPKYDKKLVKDEIINLVVQVNGKVRDMLEVPADISEDEAREKALGSEKVQKWTKDGEVVKVIFVKGKLVNIVVK